jgi:hypothetical protein
MDSKKNTLDKKGNIRPDWLFSYWVVIWFLIFYFADNGSSVGKWIHRYLNPSIALWIAVLENAATFIFMMIVRPTWEYFLKMLAMMTLIKALPLYLIRQYPIHWQNDIWVFFIVFGIYNVHLWTQDTNLVDIYKRTLTAFYEGSNKTPLFALIDSLFGRR